MMKRWLIGSSKETVSSNRLNSNQDGELCSLIRPVGIGFIIAKPYWFISSNLTIFVIINSFEKSYQCQFLMSKQLLDRPI